MTYHDFRTLHRRNCPLRKTLSCSEGGFNEFRIKILSKQQLQCRTCLQICVDSGLSAEVVDQIKFEDFAIPEAGRDSVNEDVQKADLDSEKLGFAMLCVSLRSVNPDITRLYDAI